MTFRSLAIAVSLAALLGVVPPAAALAGQRQSQDEESVREVYTGTLVGIGGEGGGRTATFTLTVTSHASRTLALRYAALLKSKGQYALLKQLDDKNVGTFALDGQVGRTVNFAYVQDTPEGRRLTILFERWLEPFEVRNGTRSKDYPFTYMDISIDKAGKGQGTLIGAAKVYFDKDDPSTLNVENFSTYPLRVVNVETKR